MLKTRIDHIVITAASLADGSEYIFRTLGIPLEDGGEHARMGTHNLLLRLGDDVYLEVIAVNPDAEQPQRPRWFGLTDAYNQPTRLATWVARTSDIDDAAQEAPQPLGPVEPMSRGPLKWRITIPEDGRLVMNGVAPALIQWEAEPHPASRLEDVGCSLVSLEARHPNAAALQAWLDRIGFEGPLNIIQLEADEAPQLIAHIQTPSGPCQLLSELA